MAVPWLVDVPQPRRAPDALRSALRALDPTAEVLSLSQTRWIVGRVRPTNESVRIAMRMLASYWASPQRSRSSARGRQRYHFALACLQGFRPVCEYRLRELDERVVREFAEGQWRMAHQRTDLIDEYEAEEQAARAERLAQLGDLDAAKDVVSFVRQSNFGYAVSSVAKPTHTRSGFTRVATPA